MLAPVSGTPLSAWGIQASTHPVRHLTSRSEPTQPCPHKNPPRHRVDNLTIASPSLSAHKPSRCRLVPFDGHYVNFIFTISPFHFFCVLGDFHEMVADLNFFSYRATRVSAPSRSLPKPRSRTVLSPSGFVWGPVTPSSKYALFLWFFVGGFQKEATRQHHQPGVFLWFHSIKRKNETYRFERNNSE